MNDLALKLAEFHFLRPWMLLALLFLPVMAWAWRRLQATRDPWRNVVDAHLLAALREPGETRRERAPLWLSMIALTIAVLAMAGPAWQRLPQPLLRSESALIIALDLSDRMRATDVAPDRLSRARFKLADLLRTRRDGQVALIAYAADAFTVAPLTDDSNTVQSLLTSLDHDTLPQQGQRADRAIKQATQLLADAGFSQGQLLILTDHSEVRDLAAAQQANRKGLRVSVLGVGTPAGAPVAKSGGGFISDASGGMLLPKRDDVSLAALAAAGGGHYRPMTVDAADLDALDLLEPTIGDASLQDEDAMSEQFRDEGAWLLLLLLPIAALLFRRGWVACLPLCVLLTPPPAAAFDLESLWQRDDQRAWQALQSEDPATARELAKDAQLRASAAYRQDDFAAAAEDFAQADDADAHYNRGNALARAGKLEEALGAYDEALMREADMADAKANRDVVQAALEQQKQQQQQSGDGEKQEPQDGEKSESEQDSESQDGEQEGEPQDQESKDGESKDQAGDADGEPKPGSGSEDEPATSEQSKTDQQQAEQQADQFAEDMAKALAEEKAGEPQEQEAQTVAPSAEETEANEQQQAMEQLLRRVPDDPGGLLRRKFAIEAQRRQLEGQEND
ncbi:MAG: VWA domain-containing protein [Pseudomarimonas sp.]